MLENLNREGMLRTAGTPGRSFQAQRGPDGVLAVEAEAAGRPGTPRQPGRRPTEWLAGAGSGRPPGASQESGWTRQVVADLTRSNGDNCGEAVSGGSAFLHLQFLCYSVSYSKIDVLGIDL